MCNLHTHRYLIAKNDAKNVTICVANDQQRRFSYWLNLNRSQRTLRKQEDYISKDPENNNCNKKNNNSNDNNNNYINKNKKGRTYKKEKGENTYNNLTHTDAQWPTKQQEEKQLQRIRKREKTEKQNEAKKYL